MLIKVNDNLFVNLRQVVSAEVFRNGDGRATQATLWTPTGYTHIVYGDQAEDLAVILDGMTLCDARGEDVYGAGNGHPRFGD